MIQDLGGLNTSKKNVSKICEFQRCLRSFLLVGLAKYLGWLTKKSHGNQYEIHQPRKIKMEPEKRWLEADPFQFGRVRTQGRAVMLNFGWVYLLITSYVWFFQYTCKSESDSGFEFSPKCVGGSSKLWPKIHHFPSKQMSSKKNVFSWYKVVKICIKDTIYP